MEHLQTACDHTFGCLQLEEWQDYVASHPHSSVFHHRKWIELLVQQYGLRIHLPAVKRDGEILASIPFLETKSLLGTRKLVALPFTDCIRALSQTDEALAELRQGLRTRDYEQYKAVVMRTDRPLAPMPAGSPWVRHTLDTSRPLADIAAEFKSVVKRNLRRAEQRKLRFECSNTLEGMQAFYDLHVTTRKKLGVPVQPRSFFNRLHDHLIAHDLGFVGLVKNEHAVIAGGVFLAYNDTFVYKYVASDASALNDRPNECLVFHAIRMAVEGGYSTFDFGISMRSQEGLRQFKSKWGAVEHDVHLEYITGDPQPLTEDSAAMKLVSVAIRHSPSVVCRMLGEVFYRYSQ